MFVLKGEDMRFRLPVALEITMCRNVENKLLYIFVYVHARQLEYFFILICASVKYYVIYLPPLVIR